MDFSNDCGRDDFDEMMLPAARFLGRSLQIQTARRYSKEINVDEIALGLTASTIKRKLIFHDIHFKEGYACIIARCPHDSKAVSSEHLFINKTTGHFVCHACHCAGSWTQLMEIVDGSPASVSKGSRKAVRYAGACKNLKGRATAVQYGERQLTFGDLLEGKRLVHLSSREFCDVTTRLEIQGLTSKTLDEFGVHASSDCQSLLLPSFHTDLTVQSVRKIADAADGRISIRNIPRQNSGALFGWQIVPRTAQTVVLTASEFDAMAVHQETDLPAVSLSYGISCLPQEALPFLERFQKIIIYFGSDVKSWEAAKQFSKKLDERRCWFIRPTVLPGAALKTLQAGAKLANVLGGSVPFGHSNIISFASLRSDVLFEFQNAEVMAGIKWTKYPLLSKILKGHRTGELTVVTGPTGSGKTTFISEYSLDLALKGVNTLWGSFEIRNVRLAKTMITQFAKIDFSKNIDQYDQWADKFQELPIYFMTFHGQQDIGRLMDTMSHATYVHDINHVIIDNLQFMMGFNEKAIMDRFSKQDHIISELRKFATTSNCHVTLVIHPKKVEVDNNELTMQSVFGSAKATQEADNVLILQNLRMPNGRMRKFLQVVKNRFDGELGLMPLKFDKESLSFAIKPKAASGTGKQDDRSEASALPLPARLKAAESKGEITSNINEEEENELEQESKAESVH